jgi:thioredoxin 2
MMTPIFAQVAKELSPHVIFAKVDTESEQGLGAQLNIRSIPTLIIFKKGKEITRQAGAMDARAMKEWVETNL